MKTITVRADVLHQLLSACNGPAHLMRELQGTRGPLVGKDNPIDILMEEWNAAAVEHHTDNDAVDRFATAMKLKLAIARGKGRTGWDDPAQCTVTHLHSCAVQAIGKGDPVDVANFCMMLQERGAGLPLLRGFE